MSSTFVSIDGKSRSYKTLVTVLVVLALSGLISFVVSYIQGHQTFGSSNVIPWGMPIVLTIFLIGLSAGSLILSSLTYVFGREEYRPIARMAVYLAIVLIFGALLSIAIDLGRPEKFWRLLMFFYMNNMSSMFAINGILYGGYFALTLTYLVLIFSGKAAYIRKMGIVAVCWAVLVHMGTGAIFGFIAAREAWVSPIKPLEFLAAAVTSGVALLILAVVLTLKFTGRKVNREMVVSLGRMLAVFIIVLMVLIFVDKMTHFYSPERGATIFMLAGQYSWMFWGLQIGLVAVVPLAILFNPRLNKTVRYVSLAGLSVVVGIFFERYYLVIPGAAYPQHYYPGHIEGVWGTVGTFAIMPVEMILSLGILAIVGLLFVLGLKYLELLPEKEPVEEPVQEEAPVAEESPAVEETPAVVEASETIEKTESGDEASSSSDE